MSSPFENPQAANSSSRRSAESNKGETDPVLESVERLPEQLRRLADDFERASEPIAAMLKKGNRANWFDKATALYAAGEFALPRLKRGMDALNEYLDSRKK